jgi:hypothetical protein
MRVLLALMFLGCGPSLRSLYEGETRFEHCYALDANKAAVNERSQCWRTWEQRYAVNATRDRAEHARIRLRELKQATSQP